MICYRLRQRPIKWRWRMQEGGTSIYFYSLNNKKYCLIVFQIKNNINADKTGGDLPASVVSRNILRSSKNISRRYHKKKRNEIRPLPIKEGDGSAMKAGVKNPPVSSSLNLLSWSQHRRDSCGFCIILLFVGRTVRGGGPVERHFWILLSSLYARLPLLELTFEEETVGSGENFGSAGSRACLKLFLFSAYFRRYSASCSAVRWIWTKIMSWN